MNNKAKAPIAAGAIAALIGGFLILAVRSDPDCKYGEGPDGECIVPRTREERDLAGIAKVWCSLIGENRQEFVKRLGVQRPGRNIILTASKEEIANRFARAMARGSPDGFLPFNKPKDPPFVRKLVKASCLKGFSEEVQRTSPNRDASGIPRAEATAPP